MFERTAPIGFLLQPLRALPLLLLSLTFSLTASAAKDLTGEGFRGAAYRAEGVHSVDFRVVTTLGEFDRLVYRNRWRGIDAADVIAEFQKFDGIAGSPAMREIWRDVLLGDFEGLDASGNEQTRLMAERLRLLNRLGYFDEAVRLYVEATQKKPIPEMVAQQGVEAMALAGSADGACLEVLMAAQHLKNETWLQNAALCSVYFGQQDEAKNYYEQVSKEAGSGFRAVYKMLRDNNMQTIQPGIPPLWRTLMLAKGASLSASSLTKADAMTLASIAASRKVPLGTRLVAAGRAADAGTIHIERLRKLYERKHRTDAAVADILQKIEAGEPLPQSDYYAAARFTFEGNARAKVVQHAIENLRPRTNIKSHVYGWIVDKLTLQPDRIKWFAKEGYALMVATNRRASADIYYETGKLAKTPLSIVHALLEQKPWTAEEQKDWQNAMKTAGRNKEETRKAYLVAKAFDVEQKLALNTHAALVIDAPAPVTKLQESIQKGGKGLTLIAALNHLANSKKMSQISTDEVSDIIAVLGKQGQFGERKKIALEILLQTVL